MRCESCGKFVSYEGDEAPEVDSEELSYEPGDEEATVTVSVRLVKNCAECGDELASTEFDIEESFEVPEDHRGDGHTLELELDEPEQTERTQTRDRHGKPIKSARYMRHYYGVSVGYTVSCSCGSAEKIAQGSLEDEVTAGSLDPA